MLNLINVSKRLSPQLPKTTFTLDPLDPEWEDKMLYPRLDHAAFYKQFACWVGMTGFYVYNFNVIAGNRNLKLLKLAYPIFSTFMFYKMHQDYRYNYEKVDLFDNYVKNRSLELFEDNKYLFETENFKRYVYF